MRTKRAAAVLLLGCLWGAAGTRAATLDITSFGAIANDTGDDVTAINNAIAAAAAGDTVFIPAGVFRISTTVNAKSNITLAGVDRDTSIVRFTGGKAVPILKIQSA